MHYLCVNCAKSAEEKTMMELFSDDDGILVWKCQDDDGIQKDDDGIRKDDDGILRHLSFSDSYLLCVIPNI